MALKSPITNRTSFFLGSSVNGVLEFAVRFFGFLVTPGRVWCVNMIYGHLGSGFLKTNDDNTFRDRMDIKERLFGSLREEETDTLAVNSITSSRRDKGAVVYSFYSCGGKVSLK